MLAKVMVLPCAVTGTSLYLRTLFWHACSLLFAKFYCPFPIFLQYGHTRFIQESYRPVFTTFLTLLQLQLFVLLTACRSSFALRQWVMTNDFISSWCM